MALDKHAVRDIAKVFGTPVYVYDQSVLEAKAKEALAFPNAFGLSVRYAMKANPHHNILQIFHQLGIQIDASSEYEVQRAILAGIPNENIMLTSQQPAKNIYSGIRYNACSLHQLASVAPKYGYVSVRINPGLGSGGTNRTNTGGPASSFGIWHEDIPEVLRIAREKGIKISGIHSHIGSGSDPVVWQKVASMSLGIVEQFLPEHDITTLNLGGGYKVARVDGDKATDLQECGEPVKQAFKQFAEKTGKRLHLEIEPGTFLVANAGYVIATAVDVKSTPGYNFIITDSGMTEVTRPSLYGAQHPITIVTLNDSVRKRKSYVVSGHCCESGDILTPAPGDSEALAPRDLIETRIGDLVVIGGAGAYCSGMCTKNYNSYPEAAEVLMSRSGNCMSIRHRQTLDQMLMNECL